MIIQLHTIGDWVTNGGWITDNVTIQFHAIIMARNGRVTNPNFPFVLPVGVQVPLWEWSSIRGFSRAPTAGIEPASSA